MVDDVFKNNPIPFEDVCVIFLRYANQKNYEKLIRQTFSFLAPDAYNHLERVHLLKLSEVCSRVLNLKLSLLREIRSSVLIPDFMCNDENSTRFYDYLMNEGAREIFADYHVLKKLISITRNQWGTQIFDILEKFRTDKQLIKEKLSHHKILHEIIFVQPNLSDPHHNGRSVTAITFSSGLKIIYKPKNLALASEFQNLLDWLVQNGAPLSFRPMKIIDRSNYGWTEYIDYLPCENLDAIKRYYQRAGMLLCLVYILNGIDCHFENIIACGEFPMLIDNETLFHPVSKYIFRNKNSSNISTADLNHYSVLHTGLLHSANLRNGKKYDISGFGGIGGQKTGYMELSWDNINTDKMVATKKPRLTPDSKNIPFTGEKRYRPQNFVTEIIDGFKSMYHFFIQKKEVLLSSDSPLQALRNQQVRFIFRPTRVYAEILNNLLQPKYLRSEEASDSFLDILYIPFQTSSLLDLFRPLIEEEKRALKQLDIPICYANTSNTNLYLTNNKIIRNFFIEESFTTVISKIQNLNSTDMDYQVSLIEKSFYHSFPDMSEKYPY